MMDLIYAAASAAFLGLFIGITSRRGGREELKQRLKS